MLGLEQKLSLYGFNNLTKTLSFNIYDVCYAKTEREQKEYIAYIDEQYNSERLTKILCDVTEMIGARILNISKQDYEPQGASVNVLIAEKALDEESIDPSCNQGKIGGDVPEMISIFRDHEPLIAPAPACTDSDHFYYKEKKLSFTKQEDVYKRSLQAAKKGKTLTFHWRGGYLTKEVLRELLDLIEKAGKERQKTALIKLNWPQAVLRVRYTDEPIQPVVTMEEANEGEETPEGTASL